MKKLIAAAGVVAMLGLSSIASAHTADDEADLTIPASAAADAGQGDIYLDAETSAAWQESNGLAGLQTQPHEHEDGEVVPPDALIGALPA
ncbi:MAG TPA: hypothetical protein VGB83_06385 [Actinomycetota bacterium]